MSERGVMVGVANLRSGAVGSVGPASSVGPSPSPSAVGAVGRVVQVNVSRGGVPKLPIAEARVQELGLAGDGHDSPSHGGPIAAVSMLAIEAIRRVAAEGHPIRPGTTGENVTTEGIEIALLPFGTRLAIGDEVIVEVTKHASPCATIAGSFTDGAYERLSSKRHPADARAYASVVSEGTIRPGDEIRVLPD